MAYDKSYKWLVTINNPIEKGFSHDVIKEILSDNYFDYWCMCDEKGSKTETFHTHLFLYKKSQVRFNKIKKLFPPAHIDFCNGSPLQNRNYLLKGDKWENSQKALTSVDGSFEESGVCPEDSKGKRNDLIYLYQYIKDGLSDYEILEIDPRYMKHLELIQRTRQTVLFEKYKKECRNIYVEYCFGVTGAGKSKSVLDKYGFENVYRITDYKNPFDNYNGQDVIVFEEFYSNRWKISDILNYLDIYPLQLPCRYMNKQACYTKVIINSNISLKDQYKDIQEKHIETWKAFLRRINICKIYSSHGVYKELSIEEFLKDSEWESMDNLSVDFE